MTRRGAAGGARRAVMACLLLSAVPATVAIAAGTARRHELAEASATVVVRDGGHVELRLQVPWAEVLRQAWQPRAELVPFLGEVVALPPATLARQVAAVQRRLAAEARVAGADAAGVPLGRWHWPAPEALRRALQRELMSRLAEGAAFEHASRLPVTAEGKLSRSPRSVRLRLPTLLGPVLVTVLQPREQWVAPGGWSAPVVLGPPGAAVPGGRPPTGP